MSTEVQDDRRSPAVHTSVFEWRPTEPFRARSRKTPAFYERPLLRRMSQWRPMAAAAVAAQSHAGTSEATCRSELTIMAGGGRSSSRLRWTREPGLPRPSRFFEELTVRAAVGPYSSPPASHAKSSLANGTPRPTESRCRLPHPRRALQTRWPRDLPNGPSLPSDSRLSCRRELLAP